MAVGDFWRIGGGILIPNNRFLHDIDGDGIPDNWSIGKIGTANYTDQYFIEGHSDHKGWAVVVYHNGAPGSDNDVVILTSERSPAASVPVGLTATSLQIWLSMQIMNSSGEQEVVPVITFYNADESETYVHYGTPIAPADTGAGYVEASGNLAIPRGNYPGPALPPNGYALTNSAGVATVDHIRLQLRIGYADAGSTVIWGFDDILLCWNLLDPGSTGYGRLETPFEISEWQRASFGFGEHRRSQFGSLRYTDTTGGAEAFRMQGRLHRATINDYELLNAAHRLCRGAWAAPHRTASEFPLRSYRLKPQPVVVFPEAVSSAVSTKLPNGFYAFFTGEFNSTLRSGLSNGPFSIPVIFEEP